MGIVYHDATDRDLLLSNSENRTAVEELVDVGHEYRSTSYKVRILLIVCRGNPQRFGFRKHLRHQKAVRGYVDSWLYVFVERPLKAKQADHGLAATSVHLDGQISCSPAFVPRV